MTFNPLLFKEHLQKAEIVIPENEIRGSLTYLSYGLEIKHKIYGLAANLLKEHNFSEINLSDIIQKTDVQKLDSITSVSNNYFHIGKADYVMAAGHEVPFYLFLKRYLKHNIYSDFPLKFFHFGSVFRFPKNTKFPFSLGERRSFLECYIVYKNEDSYEQHFNQAVQWNRHLIKDILHIPSIEVERPLITNKPFSRKTVCIDSITPLGMTVITGMSYLHDDIFTKIFSVKYKDKLTNKNKLAKAIHFGVSDHLFFSYLLNSYDGKGFRLLNKIAPFHVSILFTANQNLTRSAIDKITQHLKLGNYSFNLIAVETMKTSSYIDQNVIKGIALTIVLIERGGYVEATLFYRGDSISRKINLDDLKTIDSLLEKNDVEIIEAFRKRESDSIVDCKSLKEINDNLAQGKVCRVYLQDDDENIKNTESRIVSGEILGFSKNDTEGLCVSTGDPVKMLAYISRRS